MALRVADARHHLHVLGATGSGNTTLRLRHTYRVASDAPDWRGRLAVVRARFERCSGHRWSIRTLGAFAVRSFSGSAKRRTGVAGEHATAGHDHEVAWPGPWRTDVNETSLLAASSSAPGYSHGPPNAPASGGRVTARHPMDSSGIAMGGQVRGGSCALTTRLVLDVGV